MNLKRLIASLLREIANDIELDLCGMNENELEELIHNIAHIEMNKAEAAEFLGLSVRTFDRRIHDDLLPPGKHNAHHKDLVWYKDELLKYKG